ncbi:MAG TPA: hypothetical protein VFJ82_22855 [Longimicrobium sp.]|nr:hypothetical protein [Longimicrobium sp.]
MKRALLAALLAATAALPAAAQRDGDLVVVSVTLAKPVRTVYTGALHATLRDGWQLRARMLDEALYTLPGKAADGKTQAMLRLTFEPRGDSTKMGVTAVAVDPGGDRRCTTQPCHLAEMATALATMNHVTRLLDSLTAAQHTTADSLAAAGALGYATSNAIRVGGGEERGVQNEHAYLDALRGPAGETVTYERLGSCCQFQTPNGMGGKEGVLDAYEVTYPGLAHPVTLYINMYDPPRDAELPHGFTRAGTAALVPQS